MFPRWPLKLYAEPRLWGAIVLNEPKNPEPWRGVGIGMGDILHAVPKAGCAWVYSSDGTPKTVDGRHVCLYWRGTRQQGTFMRVRRRWLKGRLRDGTLDIVWGESGSIRTSRFELAFGLVMMSVMLALLVYAFVVPALRNHASLVDWLILTGVLLLMLSLPAIVVGVFAQGLRRSCQLFRITSTAIVPLDGPLTGIEFPYSGVQRFDDYAMRLIRLHFADRTLIVDQLPMAVAELLGREAEAKVASRRVGGRLIGYCIVGAVLYVSAMLAVRPITGMSIWQVLSILMLLPPLICLRLFGERWLKGLFAWVERRRRQRKNRDSATTGRGLMDADVR